MVEYGELTDKIRRYEKYLYYKETRDRRDTEAYEKMAQESKSLADNLSL